MSYSQLGQSALGDTSTKLPPPCDTTEQVRQFLAAAGSPGPAKTGNEESDKLFLALSLVEFVSSKGVDPNTASPQEVCDLLVKESGSKTDTPPGSSKPAAIGVSWKPVAVLGGGLAVAAGVCLLVTRVGKR